MSLTHLFQKLFLILDDAKNFFVLTSSLKSLYYSTFHCHLVQCIIIYCSATQTDIKVLPQKTKQKLLDPLKMLGVMPIQVLSLKSLTFYPLTYCINTLNQGFGAWLI